MSSPILWPEDRRFIPGFDGIRALAALAVVAYHVHDVLLPAHLGPISMLASVGWAGVDVFFALSGFLLTNNLLRTRARPDFFHHFYTRRFLRILPLYWATMALVLTVLAASGTSTGGIPWWSPLVFASNWFVADAAAPTLMLAITWSLAVEEQFYAVWPALVRFTSTRALAWIAVAVIAASPVLRWSLFDPAHPGTLMYTVCRLDSLLMGALAAMAWKNHHAVLVKASWWMAAPAVVLLGALVMGSTMAPYAPAALALAYTGIGAATSILLLAIASGGLETVAKGLSWEPLAHIGKVSFGVYLLHPIAFTLTMAVWHGAGLPAPSTSLAHGAAAYMLFAATAVGAASITYEVVERPALSLKDRFAPNTPAPTPVPAPNRPPEAPAPLHAEPAQVG